jgi:hypothetical protein
MSTVDTAYYQSDCVRVMGEVTKNVATMLGSPTAAHQKAIDDAVASIAALDAAGETAPADLQAATDAYVQNVKDGCISQRDQMNEILSLPASAQDALGYDVASVVTSRDRCDEWITAIDAAWTPAP